MRIIIIKIISVYWKNKINPKWESVGDTEKDNIIGGDTNADVDYNSLLYKFRVWAQENKTFSSSRGLNKRHNQAIASARKRRQNIM